MEFLVFIAGFWSHQDVGRGRTTPFNGVATEQGGCGHGGEIGTAEEINVYSEGV
jgi:hypothetical protein